MSFGRPAQASAAVPGLADNYVAVAARLLTLTDHPGLDLIIVLNRVGDGAEAYPSGLVMKIPRFHERLRMRTNAVRPMPVPQWGEGTLTFDRTFFPRVRPVLFGTASIVEEPRMPKKRKRKYSRGAGTEVKREMHRYKRGKAKSGKGGKGGKVKSRKQAIAIALSKARKKGKKVPRGKK